MIREGGRVEEGGRGEGEGREGGGRLSTYVKKYSKTTLDFFSFLIMDIIPFF